ncbi:MAG: hypothetical protein O7F73_13775 [Gammaproteobacteria bacterium]|nr:hypothetical protein [Gammaproteobacteria bacterium]
MRVQTVKILSALAISGLLAGPALAHHETGLALVVQGHSGAIGLVLTTLAFFLLARMARLRRRHDG